MVRRNLLKSLGRLCLNLYAKPVVINAGINKRCRESFACEGHRKNLKCCMLALSMELKFGQQKEVIHISVQGTRIYWLEWESRRITS